MTHATLAGVVSCDNTNSESSRHKSNPGTYLPRAPGKRPTRILFRSRVIIRKRPGSWSTMSLRALARIANARWRHGGGPDSEIRPELEEHQHAAAICPGAGVDQGGTPRLVTRVRLGTGLQQQPHGTRMTAMSCEYQGSRAAGPRDVGAGARG